MGQLNKADFGPDFVWGVATAAYQIEGSAQVDGRSSSIWDTFSHASGKIKTGENGDIAADFYRRYHSDLTYIRDMNMRVNRFSLSWPRIIPTGRGSVNPKGLDFYNRVIDRTLELGLEPWITLYHWDLPQILEDRGGWTNRSTVGWFCDYVDVCTKAFGDRVKHWMVLNEPSAFTVLGYMQGLHAPGRRGFTNWLPAIHHAALAQAEGGRVVRQNVPDAQIGTTFSGSWVEPLSDTPWHRGAAARINAVANRLFIEPALGMGYPWDTWAFLKPIQFFMKNGDAEKLSFDFDFIGLQTYFRMVVQFSPLEIGIFAKEVPHSERDAAELTEMGWEVYPPNMYHLLKQFAAYGGVRKIIVTENGAAYPDTVRNGQVQDPKRLKYIQDNLEQLLQAKQEGVPVEGYLAWTLMDNFEWAEGYKPRFGLVYVDYPSQRRILKSSGKWFRDFLA